MHEFQTSSAIVLRYLLHANETLNQLAGYWNQTVTYFQNQGTGVVC
jgi:hypothetical protein